MTGTVGPDGPAKRRLSQWSQWTIDLRTGNQGSFYSGSAVSGVLMPPDGANYYSPPTYPQIGAPTSVGADGCTVGYCPADPATSLATFDGVFVHPGAAQPTSVAFRADTAMTVTEVKLWSETVGNGNNGNGFDVADRSYSGGLPVGRRIHFRLRGHRWVAISHRCDARVQTRQKRRQ